MALTDRSDLASRVHAKVGRIKGGLDAPNAADIVEVIDDAVLEYSRLSPRVVTQTYSGDGTTYSFTIPTAWADRFSAVLQIEHPNDEQDPRILDDGDWRLYPTAEDPTHIRFNGTTPADGTDNISVTHTALHTVDDTPTMTPPDAHHGALVYLGAAHVCELYATQYGQTTDPTIDADAVDYRSKSDEWRQLARYFRGEAYRQLGVALSDGGGGSSVKASGGYLDIDPKTIFGADLVWRSRRKR